MTPSQPDLVITHVPASEWEAWAETNNAVVIDVREPSEWLGGTLTDSERISLSDLPSAVTTMDRSKPVLLVCATGARSTVGATWLLSIGFEKAASMDGGVKALGLI
jgi:rhodanese-related sulfurtransferase